MLSKLEGVLFALYKYSIYLHINPHHIIRVLSRNKISMPVI